ncbi:Peptidyl-prolyl cis-trans isomerase NIMA-interacting protein 1 [Stylosanthes scabra]|uniref:Peptidyl-prolyl cis-trans isomerase NIMA-interacting protein 1 n=1 Tax=Stylosanthes scabra TaxID=79078 RepID=A0ABU6RJY7_9FABA|nr:Peptidyl-prolyl cis-trans isomerase NIMA-interacting protein 1 [Stylosanthes scabra]
MYGEFTTTLMTQIVTLQLCIWVPLSLILFEVRAVKLSIEDRSATSEANNAAHVSDASTDVREVIIESEERDRISGSRSNVPVETEEGNAAGSILVMTRLVQVTVWKKLHKNQNIWASVLGLVWSLIAFSLSTSSPHSSAASLSHNNKAALPQSVLTFVFAEEYNLHPHIQSTANGGCVARNNDILCGSLKAKACTSRIGVEQSIVFTLLKSQWKKSFIEFFIKVLILRELTLKSSGDKHASPPVWAMLEAPLKQVHIMRLKSWTTGKPFEYKSACVRETCVIGGDGFCV